MSNRHAFHFAAACLSAIAVLSASPHAAAEPGLKARGGAKTSINSAVARPASRPSNTTAVPKRPAVTRPAPGQGGGINVHQDNDINVNIQGNNVQGNQRGSNVYPAQSYHEHDNGHDDWDDWDDHHDWEDHPFATAAAITAGVAVTNAIIGSIVYSVPPSCVPVSVNGITYQQCGSTWYQPQYSGTTVQYIVVVAPK